MKQILTLDDVKPLSWNNLYRANAWMVRKQLADTWHELIFFMCKKQKIRKVSGPVDIHVAAYQKSRQIDSDNICVKVIIDGLKMAGIIIDDTPEFIKVVSMESIRFDRDILIIEIIDHEPIDNSSR